jgi:uncharacterized protein YndB with AHSA1/START domain
MAEQSNSSFSDLAGEEIVITRVVDASRELVFRAWTEPERLKHWWGPKGFTWRRFTIDLRPEGIIHYCLRSPEGHEMWGKLIYATGLQRNS